MPYPYSINDSVSKKYKAVWDFFITLQKLDVNRRGGEYLRTYISMYFGCDMIRFYDHIHKLVSQLNNKRKQDGLDQS